jgi:cyclopropane-fatty-acyl-phospholipid synthase
MRGLQQAVNWVEGGWVPDLLIRPGIRRLIAMRLRDEDSGSEDGNRQRINRLVEELKASPVAVHPKMANQQHYEVPAAFFEKVLGKRLKYSCCYWPEAVESLDASEEAMLKLSCDRAELQDGQKILELGCGWGSLTVWMAEHYPNSRIVAMSNSSSQKSFIEKQLQSRGLSNAKILTADINSFQIDEKFDRVVSIEMFEHVRNYQELLHRIAGWLVPDGKLFVHIFCHRQFAYPFETEGPANWMGRYFFTGGIMPSEHLFEHFQDDLSLVNQWRVDGTHYQRTSRAWLENMDRRKDTLLPVLESVYGVENRDLWWTRWRLFFMGCEELFGYRKGSEWVVGHYLFDSSR